MQFYSAYLSVLVLLGTVVTGLIATLLVCVVLDFRGKQ